MQANSVNPAIPPQSYSTTGGRQLGNAAVLVGGTASMHVLVTASIGISANIGIYCPAYTWTTYTAITADGTEHSFDVSWNVFGAGWSCEPYLSWNSGGGSIAIAAGSYWTYDDGVGATSPPATAGPTPTPTPAPTALPTALPPATTPGPTAITSPGGVGTINIGGTMLRGPESWGRGDPAVCGPYSHVIFNDNVAVAGMQTVYEACLWATNPTNTTLYQVGNMPGGAWSGWLWGSSCDSPVGPICGVAVGSRGVAAVTGTYLIPVPPAGHSPIALVRAEVGTKWWCNVSHGSCPPAEITTGVSFFDSDGRLTHTYIDTQTVAQPNGYAGAVSAPVSDGDVAWDLFVQIDNGESSYFDAGHSPAWWQHPVNEASLAFIDQANVGSFTGSPTCVSGGAGCLGGSMVPGVTPPTCGPLSGDCTKQFIQPPAVETCTAPSSGLDATGWLSYIWCEVRNVPPRVGGFIVTLGNAVIDLLEPGQTFQSLVGGFQAAWSSHAPFNWISTLASALQDGWSTSDAGLPASFTVFGITVTPPYATIASSSTIIRAPLAAFVWFFMALKLLDQVLSFIGWSRAVPVATPEGDYA